MSILNKHWGRCHAVKDLTAAFNVAIANDNPFFPLHSFTASDLAIDMTRRISSTKCYLCLYCLMTMRQSAVAAIAALWCWIQGWMLDCWIPQTDLTPSTSVICYGQALPHRPPLLLYQSHYSSIAVSLLLWSQNSVLLLNPDPIPYQRTCRTWSQISTTGQLLPTSSFVEPTVWNHTCSGPRQHNPINSSPSEQRRGECEGWNESPAAAKRAARGLLCLPLNWV